MLLKQFVTMTDELQRLIIECEALNKSLQLSPIPRLQIDLIRAKQTLSSALFSAKIEGNPLSIVQLQTESESKHKKEVFNIKKVLDQMYQKKGIPITGKYIKAVHSQVMKGLSADGGSFRNEQSAIFNLAGVAVYVTPPPGEIIDLVTQMLKLHAENIQHPLVKATILHIQFEKIHPFLDGNGRIGRLLIHQSLQNDNLNFDGLLGFENFIENNRDEYYSLLADETYDVTDMAKFLCRAIISDTQTAIEQQHELKSTKQEELTLLPRRQEILHIVRDHQMVSFDMLHRRFMAVPVSTLRNDLLQLQKSGYIVKMGKTRGVWYTLKI